MQCELGGPGRSNEKVSLEQTLEGGREGRELWQRELLMQTVGESKPDTLGQCLRASVGEELELEGDPGEKMGAGRSYGALQAIVRTLPFTLKERGVTGGFYKEEGYI